MRFATRSPLVSRVWPVAAMSAMALAVSSPAALATPPAGLLASAVSAQAGYGTIKGRLVWGGAQAPERKVLEPKGRASKNPEVCAKDQDILSDELAVDPKTKGIEHGFAYIMAPKGANPEAVAALIGKEAEVVL